MKELKKYLALGLIYFACSCGGSSNEPTGSSNIITPSQDPVPKTVTLISPPNNSLCTGIDNGTTISVAFEWSSVEFAKTYVLSVYNADGSLFNSLETSNTSTNLSLNKSSSVTWNVKATNDSGESTSTTYNTSTPGESIANNIPIISSISFNENENSILIRVQDIEGDILFYDAIAADNDQFENATIYETNTELIGSDGNNSEQEIIIENIAWSSFFWFRFNLRDISGNQITETASHHF